MYQEIYIINLYALKPFRNGPMPFQKSEKIFKNISENVF